MDKASAASIIFDKRKDELKEIFADKSLSDYDFSDDCYNFEYMQVPPGIDKYVIYRCAVSGEPGEMYKNARDFWNENKGLYHTVVDPDSGSRLLQSAYMKLYPGICRDLMFARNDNFIQGETMNTVQTVLNEYVKCVLERDDERYKEVRRAKDGSYNRNSFTSFLELYAVHEKEIRFALEKAGADKLMAAYHTLGNFIIVPVGCNSPRGMCFLKDFWDLTLACIYNRYAKEKKIYGNDNGREFEYSIDMIFSKDRDLEQYERWLGLFGDWDTFVEKNYMEDFVDPGKGGNEKYGEPKELWDGHFKGSVLPAKEEQFEAYFSNSVKWIKRRGVLMQKALCR